MHNKGVLLVPLSTHGARTAACGWPWGRNLGNMLVWQLKRRHRRCVIPYKTNVHVGHAQNPRQCQLQPAGVFIVCAVYGLQQATLEGLEDVLFLGQLEELLQARQALGSVNIKWHQPVVLSLEGFHTREGAAAGNVAGDARVVSAADTVLLNQLLMPLDSVAKLADGSECCHSCVDTHGCCCCCWACTT